MTTKRWLTEGSAAFADLGTFLPLALGLIVIAGVDPIGLLYGFGLFALMTALIYRRPIPIQPMKATAAMGVAGLIGPDVLIATGILLGLTLIILSQTDLTQRFKRLIPRTVLLGMRSALAITLIANAFALQAISLPTTVLLLAALIALQFTSLSAFSCILILIGGYLLLGDTTGITTEFAGVNLPQFMIPDVAAFSSALEVAFLPQLALTLTNALILTAVIAQDYFPEDAKPVTEKRLALSSGLANLLFAPLGAIPMCHGAGGLPAHHAMGSRTGWSIAIFGSTCIVLAALLGTQVTQLIVSIPVEIIAVLVLFASWHLADPPLVAKTRTSCKVVIGVMAVIALWGGLMTALVAGVVLEWSISRYLQTRVS